MIGLSLKSSYGKVETGIKKISLLYPHTSEADHFTILSECYSTPLFLNFTS
ncbi:hypothetical protein PATA110616_06265 [Paenibacillus tarimensis]